jgi:hypothetical protein
MCLLKCSGRHELKVWRQINAMVCISRVYLYRPRDVQMGIAVMRRMVFQEEEVEDDEAEDED